MSALPYPTDPRAEGERRRDAGMLLAVKDRQRRIWRCQLALLDAIRTDPQRTASTDAATSDLWRQYPDGGKWRGSVPRQLAALGLIQRAGVITSVRASRRAGLVRVWQGTDDEAIDRYRARLRLLLADAPSSTQPSLFPGL